MKSWLLTDRLAEKELVDYSWFWISFFFRLCHFPNALLWKETCSWSHTRSSTVHEDYCRLTGKTCWQPPKKVVRGNNTGLLTSYIGQMFEQELDSDSERMWKSLLTRGQLTGGILYWYEAGSPNSHHTKISAGTQRDEPLHWRTRHHVPLRSHRGMSCCFI